MGKGRKRGKARGGTHGTDPYVQRRAGDALALVDRVERVVRGLGRTGCEELRLGHGGRRFFDDAMAGLRDAIGAAVDRAYVDGNEDGYNEAEVLHYAVMDSESAEWSGAGRTPAEAKAGVLRAWRADPRTDKSVGLARLEELYGIRVYELRAGESYKDGERGLVE